MADEDPKYAEWIRGAACAMCGVEGRSEIHHSTHGVGMSQRGHDHTGIPLCRWCHRDFHGACGRFKGWDKERRLKWQDEQVVRLRDGYTRKDVF